MAAITYTANYTLDGRCTSVLRSDGLSIPRDPANADYAAFLQWNAAQPTPISLANVASAARKPRRLYDIAADLNALTSTQKSNVATDLFGGNPPKWALDAGPNAASLFSLYSQTQMATLSAADVSKVKVLLAAAYCQDNPAYLVNPTFDASINVAGDQPA